MQQPLDVHAEWDETAAVWVATSDAAPGLAIEAATAEGLVAKLKVSIPELRDASGVVSDRPVAFELLTRRFELVA